MRLNTLEKLYSDAGSPAIDVPEAIRCAALKPLERMLKRDLNAANGLVVMARCCPADQLYFRLRGGQRRRSAGLDEAVDASVASDMVPPNCPGEQNPSSDADAEVGAGRMEGCTSACQPLSECAEVGCQTGVLRLLLLRVSSIVRTGVCRYGPMNTDGECGRILRAASRQSAKISCMSSCGGT